MCGLICSVRNFNSAFTVSTVCLYKWIDFCLCVAFNVSYTTLLSRNCLYGWPLVVSAPIQGFIALSVQLCGDYIVHRGALYLQAASGL